MRDSDGKGRQISREREKKPRSEKQVEKGREKARLPLEWLIQRRISGPDLLWGLTNRADTQCPKQR